MKIKHDDNEIHVVVTRGVEEHPPDIWLNIGNDIVHKVIIKITVDEARELANILLLEAGRARIQQEDATWAKCRFTPGMCKQQGCLMFKSGGQLCSSV